MPKHKNNEARSKFTGSHKKSVYTVFTFPLFPAFLLFLVALMAFLYFFLHTFLVFLMSFFPSLNFMVFMLSHLRSCCTSRPLFAPLLEQIHNTAPLGSIVLESTVHIFGVRNASVQ